MVKTIIEQRGWLNNEFLKIDDVEKVYPSDANFILIQIKNANTVYKNLINKGIVVRNRSNVALCGNCLRITVGTQTETQLLIQALKQL